MRQLFGIAMIVFLLAVGYQPKVHIKTVLSEPTELEKFLEHMAHRESDNTPSVVNRFGMLGKYQFSPATIRILGVNVSQNQFLKNEELQDSVMVRYMRANYRDLKDLIARHEGKRFKGVVVTRAGVLAAAHLGGSTNVRKYFADASDYAGRTDANGTSLRDYMLEFGKYNLREIF